MNNIGYKYDNHCTAQDAGWQWKLWFRDAEHVLWSLWNESLILQICCAIHTVLLKIESLLISLLLSFTYKKRLVELWPQIQKESRTCSRRWHQCNANQAAPKSRYGQVQRFKPTCCSVSYVKQQTNENESDMVI